MSDLELLRRIQNLERGANKQQAHSHGGSVVLGYDYSTSDITVDPDPTLDAAISGISVAFTLAAAKTVKIEFSVLKTGAHPDRYSIYDTTKILPVNAAAVYYDQVSEELGLYYAHYSNIISLAAGSHTITLKHNAALSTAAVTFREVSLICTQL